MRHVTTTVAIGMVAALALTACGRAGDDGGTVSAGTSTTIDDEPATGQITVWAMGEEAGYLPDFLAAFTEENPDAEVSVTSIPWSDVATKVQTAVAGGSVPDVVMIGTSMMPLFISTGGLAAVPDGLVDADGFVQGAADSTIADGVTYGVPWYVETRVLYYRTDLAEAAGVTAPTTWDELTDFATALQRGGADYGIQLPVGDAEDSTQVVMPFYVQAGGQVLNDEGTAYTLEDDAMVQALEYYASFFQDGLASSAGYGDTQASAFVDGSAPAFFSGPWVVNQLAELTSTDWVQDNVGTVVVPAGTDGNASYIGGASFGVFADAQNPEGGWKLIRWLTESETEQQWYGVASELPALQAAWDGTALTSSDRVAVFSDQLQDVWAPPTVPSWDELSGVIESEAEKVAAGTETAQDAATAIQAQADTLGLGW
ncbi:MAG TPA: extracellular solute-binding protein [Cellulomonas sp.]